jgi:hypothetical protein
LTPDRADTSVRVSIVADDHHFHLASSHSHRASLSVPPLTVVGCTFPTALQGTFKRQNESHQPKFVEKGIREPLQYEDVYIGPSSAPYWGDCYDSIGDSYVLGLKWVPLSNAIATP